MSRVGDEVGLLFDSGHMTFAGGDAVAMLAKHVKRVCHVHCKDVRPDVIKLARNRNWSFLESVINGAFTVPGDGAVDFPALMGILREQRLRGLAGRRGRAGSGRGAELRVRGQGLPHAASELRQVNEPARQRHAAGGRDIVAVTPQSAGWKYVGFAAHRLAPRRGDVDSPPATNEVCVVVLRGTVTVAAQGQTWREIGKRDERVRRRGAVRGLRACGRERHAYRADTTPRSASRARPGRARGPRASSSRRR